ncbi:MBL fold metallo-hydrolase [Avibacterium sp. 20-126]|uniref:MBL fold metallo-hydrolase n=1 Tax=Avibacterium sp. 20-126 TaxID=2911524 RepID=UPI00218C8ABB|nr:MBL fold metallo-hydrolase [Avibacterium sp. 20-126]
MRKLTMLIWILAIIVFLALCVFAYLQLPIFGAKPTGERLQRMQASLHYQNGKFHNLTPTQTITGDKSMVRATWDFLFHGNKNVRPSTPVPAIKTDLTQLPHDKNAYVWLGHSTYFMQLDGKRFLIDPVLTAITPLPFGGKPFLGTDIYQADDLPAVDYLIITHDHYDHLEYDTVKRIKERVGKVIAPLGVGAHLARWGYRPEQIIELDWQQKIKLAQGFELTALPARHASGRALSSNNTLWASYLLQTPSETIYLGGDSGYDPYFQTIGKTYPNISLAILENGQYSKDWAQIHLLPDDLIHAIKDLNPHTVITVHHSKFELATHDWNEPLKRFSENAEREHIRYAVPKIGEVWDLTQKKEVKDKWWE